METINHEYYVSPEVAKLLKEAGFDWKQYSFYNSKSILINGTFSANWNDKIWDIDGSKVSAPTLEVAQRWLREVKNCYVGVEEFVHNLDKNNIYYTYNWVVYLDGDRHSGSDYDNTRYYEVALETSIKKALELILEEGE